ncbi:MAG: glycogen debranching protein GlgX [Bauldia sp.]|nr:glycogen debranching protein GlgX [Bauldia sp.]
MKKRNDGVPSPLGASYDGRGVNFALYSAHATKVELCLFDPTGRRETARIVMPARTDNVWHVYLSGVVPGQLYGYRVHGPYEPQAGHRFNPHKLLIDPYASQLFGKLRWHDAVYGYRIDAQRADLTPDRRDSAPMMPKCVVEDPAHHWGDDRLPRHAWEDTVIYEAHVKGLTQLHPDVPQPIRGTYDALGHPAVVEHLANLGITAVELLPIHAFVDDRFLVNKGLRNFWGYSTLNYFAPEPRYFGAAGATGLRAAVSALHEAGIEVILDVVYNHTAEGNHLGPTLSFRGIDNATYYKLPADDPRHYWDSTGTGNTLDVSNPVVLRLVMDSLRHWVQAYHIDGFRFDLASALARRPYEFDLDASFLAAVAQDPVLSRVKLIAEPWDVGPGGYRVGGFPPGWSEWNDRYRDTLRGFWRGDPGQLPALAQSLAGSREIYAPSGRGPRASINYICSHDGFTLADLFAYNERHNYANGEDNNDGHGHNLSTNCGVEGPTEDSEVLALRARLRRSALATVMLSIGTPMILAGDEIGRSQDGNNNAYCQDNSISWIDWEAGLTQHADLLDFAQALAALRHSYDAFRRRDFFEGVTTSENGLRDVYWLAPEGRVMTDDDWTVAERRTIGFQIGNHSPDGRRFLIILNAAPEPVEFQLPPDFPSRGWMPIIDTAAPSGLAAKDAAPLTPGGSRRVDAQSLLLFRHENGGVEARL